ncbi:MAG: SCP2 sterol-binding domain-containing protein [Kangiellaceae bacterium]|jgi:ubiquinone biosynthesis protein UbiJ|nr:SCP2 sterol-binding domain-containing protein [Kangiellaceae bacterium]
MLTINLATASALETVIEKLLSLDNQARDALTDLNGKMVAIKLTDWQLSYFFHIKDNAIEVTTQSQQQPHVTMEGSSFAFFNMASNERGGDSLFTGEVHFSGEVGTAQKFQAFWQNISIDWEEELSKYTGDIVAHNIGQLVKKTHQGVSKLFGTAQQNISEYLKEESRATPSPDEVEYFYDQLDDLKSDINRIEARINRLDLN